MDEIGTHRESAFPSFRNPTIDTLAIGKKKHHIPVLLEVDVTEGRRLLRAVQAAGGPKPSFTAWVIACLGRAAAEHEHVHALRKGRRRLVVFDDVDVAVLIERSLSAGEGPSRTLPMPCVIRRTNGKSVREIHDEIRAAQAAPVGGGEVQIDSSRPALATRLFVALPAFLRHLLFWRRVRRDPFLAKRTMGTVAVTSVASLGGGGAAWGIPLGIHPLIVAIGNIARKPGLVGDRVEPREYLSLTVLFDHDVTDGAPAARFIRRLRELLEAGHGAAGDR